MSSLSITCNRGLPHATSTALVDRPAIRVFVSSLLGLRNFFPRLSKRV